MNPQKYLNQSRLQFNAYGKSVFIKNIKESTKDSKITNWQEKVRTITNSPSFNDKSSKPANDFAKPKISVWGIHTL